MPAVIFVSFLVYGFVRPFISKAIRREIEEDSGEENPETPQADAQR
jgi:CDP-diacylglycerol--serine O-phosphatidyltransferase